jgi:hypothetical protein
MVLLCYFVYVENLKVSTMSASEPTTFLITFEQTSGFSSTCPGLVAESYPVYVPDTGSYTNIRPWQPARDSKTLFVTRTQSDNSVNVIKI